ncbi:DUF4397 domain-containing protein [Flavobacterium ginsenosidimutans]|uniref:DUF4397 domain-containing protein n=1 Tax=Flavobacterium ginsenosidimutans TaxID=687844 RepID=A0ABZ2Q2R2_9FLAO
MTYHVIKSKKIFSKGLAAAVLLFSTVAISSCEKNDIDDAGTAQLKVVNASSTSAEQRFFLVNKELTGDALAYTEYSDYISTYTGNRLVGSFRDAQTGAEVADGELWMANGERYTVYLAGSGSKARVKMFEDKLSTPSAGRARIKFIHLSDGAPSDIRIKDASGDNIVNSISRNIASGYQNIPPGTLTFSIYGLSSGNLLGTFDVPDLLEGKNYSIYITGDSSNNLEVHKVQY